MNSVEKSNRQKRLRLATLKKGVAQPKNPLKESNINYSEIEKQAATKTPKAQRTGNYYTQVSKYVPGVVKGKGNTYKNLQPLHKLTKKLMQKQANKSTGLFNPMKLLNYLFRNKAA